MSTDPATITHQDHARAWRFALACMNEEATLARAVVDEVCRDESGAGADRLFHALGDALSLTVRKWQGDGAEDFMLAAIAAHQSLRGNTDV